MPRQRSNHNFSLSPRASVSAGWTLGDSAQSDGVGGAVGGREGRGDGLAVGPGVLGAGGVVGSPPGSGVGSSGSMIMVGLGVGSPASGGCECPGRMTIGGSVA